MPDQVTTFAVRIRADKSGPEPAEGQPWPLLGVELPDPLPKGMLLPVSFVQRHSAAPWLDVVGADWVERPSRPGPAKKDGSAAVAPEHRNPQDGPPPHTFMHADRFVFHTLNHGDVTYVVTQQPDKYLDKGKGKEKPDAKVTVEDYEAGHTRVDHFYTCVLEG